MDWLWAPQYELGRTVFQRLLAVVYLVAFVSTALQFRPLLGARGLLPTRRFLAATPFRRAPSLFHLHYSDRFAVGAAWAGALLSALAVTGVPDAVPLWAGMLVWFSLWALYLSFVNVGQAFYGFTWEALLVEAGFLAVFLGNARTAPPLLVIVLIRWLLFRLEVGAGLIKLRHDRCWRDLTCLAFHHETQPLPNPLSWYFHRLPPPVHKLEVLANHVSQLVLPFGLFAPQPVAAVCGGLIILTQCWLMLSGNFAWLNLLTITLAVVAIPDSVLAPLTGLSGPEGAHDPAWLAVLSVVLAAVVVILSWRPVRNLASRHQLMNASFEPLRLVNTYGLFGRITRTRYEVVVEGTAAAAPGSDAEWREFGFKAKPGDPRRRPRQVGPYHLRLDWLMWFAALSPAYARAWFVPLVAKLLEGDPATLRLLGANPFPDRPPEFVRAVLYRYRFTTRAERRATGRWWVRERVGDYLPPATLSRRRLRTPEAG
jgi:preprotein translocase subunit YajC